RQYLAFPECLPMGWLLSSLCHHTKNSWSMHHVQSLQVETSLSRTKLLSLHSMIQLRRVLRSDRCECCPEYGAYLFLPTCVRCCWECLNANPSLRAISLK